MEDFIIEFDLWQQLKEGLEYNQDFYNKSISGLLSAPPKKEHQKIVMKAVMDGNTYDVIAKKLNITITNVKTLLRNGMEEAGVKNLHELILFGLKSGLINDKQINVEKVFSLFNKGNIKPASVLYVLMLLSDGYTFPEIESKLGGRTDAITKIRKIRNVLSSKFGLGKSESNRAKYIRFALAVTGEIIPPKKETKPNLSIIPSKFRPANIDPTIPVYDHPAKIQLGDKPDRVYLPKRTIPFTPSKSPPKTVKTTSVQTALWLLGINKNAITKKDAGQGKFWERPSEYLWSLLELAKKRFDYEIAHAHPDRGGDIRRATQLNSAWNLVKKAFARRGYVLHK